MENKETTKPVNQYNKVFNSTFDIFFPDHKARESSVKVGSSSIPAYGQKVSYIMEDGERVSGKVSRLENYGNHIVVTVEREDGSLYDAMLIRRNRGN